MYLLLLVLYSVLLEDKQKFNHGRVISIIFAWINWVFRSYFRGLKWIIIWFIPLFLLLCLALLVLSVFAEFKFTSLNQKIRTCFWGPRTSNKIPKEAQNDPTQAKHAGKNKYKTQRSGSRSAWSGRSHYRQPVVSTTAHGGGRTVMLTGTHGGAPLCARVVSFSFMPFRLPERFVDFACYFAFKMNVFGSLSRPPIPLIPPFFFIL